MGNKLTELEKTNLDDCGSIRDYTQQMDAALAPLIHALPDMNQFRTCLSASNLKQSILLSPFAAQRRP